MNLNTKDLVVIDVETSGVNLFRHALLSVALVPFDDELPPQVVYVRPSAIEWSEFARKNFERFAFDWDAQALPPEQACLVIENYLSNLFPGRAVTPVGHNVAFDLGFLKKLAFLGNRDEIAGLSHRAVDTHTLLYLLALRGKVPDAATKSDGAFNHYGITFAEGSRHTALGDAQATKELLRLILRDCINS